MFSSIGHFAADILAFMGYPGVFFLMALESMIFPLPSELLMPFAGFLAVDGQMNFGFVILASSLGSLFGSLLSYFLGFYGGTKMVLKFGKYLFLDEADLEWTQKWFREKGKKTIFISRFIPVVRHLISIPAGIGKMNLAEFSVYTVVGATIWNTFLAYLGYILGKNWASVRHYSEYISISVAILLVIGGGFMVYRHIRHKRLK
jgi:membrane protein DedA with SNARE-associated domain